jgi:hypothetical protein
MKPNGTEDEINHSNIKWTMLDYIHGVKQAEPNGTERKRLDSIYGVKLAERNKLNQATG